MARTLSRMVELGTPAPEFDLPVANPDVDDLNKATRSIEDFVDAHALVVIFTCNHCPYANAVEGRLNALAREYQPKGVAFVAICPNDSDAYPDDSFDEMARRAREKAYPFPYLQDSSQDVARAYGAECTPDFFLFDRDRKLQYRGRIDDGRPGTEPSRHDLREAIDGLLESGQVTIDQHPSMGCNVKWRKRETTGR